MPEMCQSNGCQNEARAAVHTTKGGKQTTLIYDNRDAPGGAERLCKGHAVATMAALASDLIDEDD